MPQPRQINIGIVEDDEIMGSSLFQRFELEGHHVHWWKTGSDAVNSLEFFKEDIIVCDIRLPDITGETVLRHANRDGMAPPFLFITGYGEIDQAVRLMRLGACDYITKPFEIDEFLGRVERNARGSYGLKNKSPVLGVSRDMRDLQKNLKEFCQTGFPLLITGEIGVGKESAAQYYHAYSSANGRPFISVDCAAIPSDLLEKELFGMETGAGDTGFHKGYAERVGAGTLYLKGISRIPLNIQSMLMALIEDKSFRRAGSSDVWDFFGRLVVSDSADLQEAVSAGLFREDVLFRLSVLKVFIPALRHRPDDIEWLLPQMVADACSRQGQLSKVLSAQVGEAALEHDWPGNALEMRNRVERAVALSRDHELTVADLFPDHTDDRGDDHAFPSLAQAREEAEKRQIVRALERSSGQIGEAAKLLHVSRTTLWEKMSRLDIGQKDCSDS